MAEYRRCYAEISLSNIRHNVHQIRRRLPEDVKLLAVVKANAYGHGAKEVATYLELRVDAFATATIEEAIELRESGITHPIMLLGYCAPAQYAEAIAHDVALVIYREDDAEKLREVAAKCGRRAAVHIAVDTGMTRIGFMPDAAQADVVASIASMPEIDVQGMFTHLACADQMDQTYTMEQLARFDAMREMLRARGISIPVCHACNSAGIMELDDHRYDMVRAGIILYGIYPSEDVHKERLSLRPALAWRTHVIHIKEVPRGVGVSYGATWRTEREMTRIATLSVGYADGYPRALSSKGSVLIRGQRAPILGRVCMDQMMVDITDIPDVQMEDVVTLIGRDGDAEITVEEVADPAGRFNYEMLCDISARVPRIYV